MTDRFDACAFSACHHFMADSVTNELLLLDYHSVILVLIDNIRIGEDFSFLDFKLLYRFTLLLQVSEGIH